MDGSIDIPLQSALAEPTAASPRSAVRARLAAAIDELAAAGAELAAAQEPASRLAAVIAEAADLEAELATLRAADESKVGAWLAGGSRDPRPEPSPATAAAEKRLAALTGDAGAARTALPAAERAFQHCAQRVRELQRCRDAALCGAAIDAARDFAGAYRAALTAALERAAALHGLRDELLRRGNHADAAPGALDAAARVGELIAETKRTAAARNNPEAARRLLAALVANPDARL
jgi:hypothetical protein